MLTPESGAVVGAYHSHLLRFSSSSSSIALKSFKIGINVKLVLFKPPASPLAFFVSKKTFKTRFKHPRLNTSVKKTSFPQFLQSIGGIFAVDEFPSCAYTTLQRHSIQEPYGSIADRAGQKSVSLKYTIRELTLKFSIFTIRCRHRRSVLLKLLPVS